MADVSKLAINSETYNIKDSTARTVAQAAQSTATEAQSTAQAAQSTANKVVGCLKGEYSSSTETITFTETV